VPDNPRPPTTLRITRPWGSEKEFVEGDIACFGRTAILLPGAPAREPGELIRFEIVLSHGTPVFRGEGNVVAHHLPGGSKPAGLEVRFTRIDARSKLILDRVRERRTTLTRQGSVPPPPLVSHPPPGHPSFAPGPAVMSMPAPPGSVISMPAVTDPAVRRARSKGPVPPPPNRDEILARLRERAQKLEAHGGFAFKKR
jgi:hypothetical protein